MFNRGTIASGLGSRASAANHTQIKTRLCAKKNIQKDRLSV